MDEGRRRGSAHGAADFVQLNTYNAEGDVDTRIEEWLGGDGLETTEITYSYDAEGRLVTEDYEFDHAGYPHGRIDHTYDTAIDWEDDGVVHELYVYAYRDVVCPS